MPQGFTASSVKFDPTKDHCHACRAEMPDDKYPNCADCRKTSLKVTITHEIPLDRIGDLLCSAYEQGSSYWCMEADRREPTDIVFSTRKDKDGKIDGCYAFEIPMNPGGKLVIKDQIEGQYHDLEWLNIQMGLDIFAKKFPKHFADFLSEDDDATTADIFFQCCVLADAPYG